MSPIFLKRISPQLCSRERERERETTRKRRKTKNIDFDTFKKEEDGNRTGVGGSVEETWDEGVDHDNHFPSRYRRLKDDKLYLGDFTK